ncbi:MAG: N-acetylmuramoyl-L-alanine amidase [Deltaproteobacteria bacterium]|nr:N-acetylmuramoyl-L-alanine amidase [Deltaproteobacteria bacterium]
MALACATLAASCVAAGCDGDAPTTAPPDFAIGGGKTDADSAEALLAPSADLPVRAEVVALTDRLSIAASRSQDPPEAARLTMLSARLRERVWRFDRAGTDAREAIELYGNVVETMAGKPQSCDADLQRARLLGELSLDGAETYRQAYLAMRRQAAHEEGAEARQACVARLEQVLTGSQAYRPTGLAWDSLEQEGTALAQAHRTQAAAPVVPSPLPAGSATSPDAGLPTITTSGQVVVMPAAAMITDKPAKLTAVQPYSSKLGGRVVLSLSAPARYEVGVLAPDDAAGRGHRVYVDLLNTKIKKQKKSLESTGLIEGVRLGHRKNGTRVVLDLSAEAYRRIFYIPNPFRVVIDLSTRPPATAASTSKGGKRIVKRVALDPGHGGWDAGAIGPTGLREKDVALDIAHRAAPTLAADLGIETMLTRDTDTFIPLEERTARANGFGADLFISIHCNATENGQAHGVEVFFLDPTRELDKRARQVAARENLVGLSGGTKDPGTLDAQLASIAAGLNVADVTARSRLFAELLRKSTMASMQGRYAGTVDHGVKTAGFFVLLGADMPAVLFETSFISNPDDEARLTTADYRQKLADGVVNAIRAYREGHN